MLVCIYIIADPARISSGERHSYHKHAAVYFPDRLGGSVKKWRDRNINKVRVSTREEEIGRQRYLLGFVLSPSSSSSRQISSHRYPFRARLPNLHSLSEGRTRSPSCVRCLAVLVCRFVARTHALRLKARKLARLLSDKCRREEDSHAAAPRRRLFLLFSVFRYFISPFLLLYRASTRSLPRARLYTCILCAYTRKYSRVRMFRRRIAVVVAKERPWLRECTHAVAHARMRSEPRWFRLFARTHARNDARGSSFLRATDAPIRARVSFVIRENVNQSLLAAARSSGPNLPRGSAFLFVFQSRAFWTRPHAICRVRCG